MNNEDIIREIQKAHDVMMKVEKYLYLQATANATLHMSETVRPAPLVQELGYVTTCLTTLIMRLEEEVVGNK